ncbi:MAG: rod shape-determining protein RodA [Anaerolineales bacterium]|nr:rod shape-determining protein RodA [Anaerolineales bacterium]
MSRSKIWRHFDLALLGAVAVLIIFGTAMIRSTLLSSPDGGAYEMSRQLVFVLVGVPIVFVISAVDYRFWGRIAGVLYGLLIVLLVLVELLAVASFGAARWLDLGIVQFQPSELGKFLIVLTLGAMVARQSDQTGRLGFITKTLVHVGVPVVLIFIQPDLSTSVIYIVIWFAVMWAAGIRMRHLALLAVAALAAVPVGFFTILEIPQLRYMADRLIVYAVPDVTSPAYQDAAYNIRQALISIGSGGLFGEGYGQGSQVQLRFLKVRHTDFIFSAISNEFGFVGAVLVIGLIAFIVFRIFRAGQLARDPFGSYICYGIGAIFLYQSFFNIGMNMKLLPVSGLPLPFVSYGGSALWTFLFGVGLVEAVVLRQKQIEF